MDKGLPDKTRAGKALDYLIGSDEAYAQSRASLKASEMRLKQERDIAFLEADGTQGEKAAKANIAGRVKLAAQEYEKAVFECELLEARRATAQLLIGVWQSLNKHMGV